MVRRLQGVFLGVSWAAFFGAVLIFSLSLLWGSRGRGPPMRQRRMGQ